MSRAVNVTRGNVARGKVARGSVAARLCRRGSVARGNVRAVVSCYPLRLITDKTRNQSFYIELKFIL